MSYVLTLVIIVVVLAAAGYAARQLRYRYRTVSEWYYFFQQRWVRWTIGAVAGLFVLLFIILARH